MHVIHVHFMINFKGKPRVVPNVNNLRKRRNFIYDDNTRKNVSFEIRDFELNKKGEKCVNYSDEEIVEIIYK